MLSEDAPLLTCSRGCVGGQRHYKCIRAKKEGTAVGGGLVVVCAAGKVKVAEAPVDKALLFSVEGTMQDGSCIDLHVVAMPPLIPGIALQTFPVCDSLTSFGTPVLLKMVSTIGSIPTKPFLGLNVELWKKCLLGPCSRKRFVNVCRKKIPSGVVVPHKLRFPVPQLPPVHKRASDLFVQCQYCMQQFASTDEYLEKCAPDFV